MKQMTKEVTAFKCIWCGEIFKDEINADQCAFEHARTKLANTLLRKNHTLWTIKYYCGFNWNLSKEQEKITQDNCFKFPHWQCCEKPAYKIIEIEEGGFLRMWGIGNWSGGYGNVIPIDKLPKPYPKEELYIYKKIIYEETID